MAVAALGLEVDCDDANSDSDSSLTLEIWDSHTPSNWSPFWNELKNEQLQTDNYNCQICQIYFFNALKDLPAVTQFRSRERRKLHFRESNFKNFPGNAPGPPKEILPPTLNICACGVNVARPPAEALHPVLPNATEILSF